MITLQTETRLNVPNLHTFEESGVHYALDSAEPNWVAVDERGHALLDTIVRGGGELTMGDLVVRHAATHTLEAGKAWVHVHDFLQGLNRAGMLSDGPVLPPPYPGRSALIAPEGLKELWIQVNNMCNLTCTHCLVSSGPGQDPGLPVERLQGLVDRACELGLERLYLTGGEPFVKKDICRLIRHATDVRDLEVIVLTNGTVLKGPIETRIKTLDRSKVKFQVSLDGARAETHDRFRGPGTFDSAVAGASLLADLGFDVALTTIAANTNLVELPLLPEIVRSVGASSQHLMWAFRRGRARAMNDVFPDTPGLLASVMHVVQAAEDVGTTLDNLEVVQRRVNGVPGVKYDLGNGGWDSLCIYSDGRVYPTAALVAEPALLCGDTGETDLEDILVSSPVLQRIRQASLADKPEALNDPYRFLTGGGDWEHAWTASGDPIGEDPYYPIGVALVRHAMVTLGKEKLDRRNLRSGYDAPLVLHAMGEGAVACGTADGTAAEQPVLTLHSNCVLSFDVDKPRARVREFYSEAAAEPQPALCCPTRYDDTSVGHIPQDVLDRFYGCGSPVTSAGIESGETVVDLGCGAGIDVFVAAKFVGAEGAAIGVDMTDGMLAVARENKVRVAASLGYDAVEFRKGFLEEIPVETGSVDLVTSNCVVNLSPDKPRVFDEIWRILKNHGRIVISDIVSEQEVPPHLKVNPQLWGECLVGALTQDEFLARLERAGFFGLTVRERTYWREVEGYRFYSMMVEGYKFEKQAGCVFQGHHAVYLGPGKAFVDEEGHLFPRSEPYEICTDTVAKLSQPPYRDMFAVLEPGQEAVSYACCTPEGACC